MHVLLNWLGQGAIVALIAAAALHAIPRSRTKARSVFAWTACLIVLALPAVPYALALVVPVASAGETIVAVGPVVSVPVAWWTSSATAIALWTLWSVGQGVRIAVGAAALRKIRRHCRDCPPEVQARLHHWSRVRAAGRPTRVVLSCDVRSAAVLGCGAPVIALAPSLVDELSDADLDRVVIHEWAHVQRRDDVAQLVQRLVRVVAGWHPGVRWLEQQIEIEREAACDEVAVSTTGSAKGYATCLTAVAALSMTSTSGWPALAVVSSSGLRERLVRILAAERLASERPWRALAFATSGAIAALAVVVGSVHVVTAATIVSSLSPAVRPVVAWQFPAPTSRTSDLLKQLAVADVTEAPRPSRSTQRARAESRELGASPVGTEVQTPPPVADGAAPPVLWPLEIPTDTVAATFTPEPHVDGPEPQSAPASRVDAPEPADGKVRTPWEAAADAGTAIGRGSQKAGVATAGFFSGFAKKIARSF